MNLVLVNGDGWSMDYVSIHNILITNKRPFIKKILIIFQKVVCKLYIQILVIIFDKKATFQIQNYSITITITSLTKKRYRVIFSDGTLVIMAKPVRFEY